MKHFKLAMIVSAIVFPLGIVAGFIALYMLFQLDIPNRQKEKRAGMIGSGLGVLIPAIVAPFWLYGAAKLGKERRGG